MKNMRFIISVVFFLSFCTFVMGQMTKYSDTTYQVFINKSSSVRLTAQVDTSKGVTIQNSFPKGDGHTDPDGKTFGYAVFWTRVMNETASPLELSISFSADSFAISVQRVSYVKIFLPPDKMTMDKESLYNYGATGLTSFLDTGLNKPTMLRKTINAKEEYLFYVGLRPLVGVNGSLRTGFVLKGQNLFYRISTSGQSDAVLIPCGQITLKK
jgi:hypothetical protein